MYHLKYNLLVVYLLSTPFAIIWVGEAHEGSVCKKHLAREDAFAVISPHWSFPLLQALVINSEAESKSSLCSFVEQDIEEGIHFVRRLLHMLHSVSAVLGLRWVLLTCPCFFLKRNSEMRVFYFLPKENFLTTSYPPCGGDVLIFQNLVQESGYSYKGWLHSAI